MNKWDWDHTFLASNAVILEINEITVVPGTQSHYQAFLADALKHLPE